MALDARLVIVNGHPASGKTTLAKELAKRLSWPCFTKDGYKEILFEFLGAGNAELGPAGGRVAMQILLQDAREVLGAGGCCVLEANFSRELASGDYSRLIQELGLCARQIVLDTDPGVLFERFRQRASSPERHPGHMDTDPARLEEWKQKFSRVYEPLDLEVPLLRVDTTDFQKIDPNAILAWVRGRD